MMFILNSIRLLLSICVCMCVRACLSTLILYRAIDSITHISRLANVHEIEENMCVATLTIVVSDF